MVNSVDYLFRKSANEKTKIYPKFSFTSSKDDFVDKINANIENYKESNPKGKSDIDINNTIKHAVVTFHPNDISKLNNSLDEIIAETVKNIGIDPANMNLTAFVHNDTLHPHVHIIWSRIGNDLERFKDSKIGHKFNEVAKSLESKYELTKGIKKQGKVYLKSTEKYNVTNRAELLTCLMHAAEYANDKKEFIDFLKSNNISRIKNNRNETVYIMPNRSTINGSTIPSIFNDDKLLRTLQINKPSKDLIQLRESIGQILKTSHTIEQIKERLPENARIKYYNKGDIIYNINIQVGDHMISGTDLNIANIQLHSGNVENYNISNFTPIFNKSKLPIDTEDVKAANKYKKRGKEIGIKKI